MSIWTHVTGIIRVDGRPAEENYEKIKEIMGVTCKYRDNDEIRKACTAPKGREDSIQYYIHEYATGFPWAIIAIWGDLRDYDNLKEIKEWVNGIYDAFDDYDGILFIRQGIVTCYVDNGSKIEQITIPYHCD